MKDVAENFIELVNWLDSSGGRTVAETFKEFAEDLIRWDLGKSIAGLQGEQEISNYVKSIKLYAKSILWDIDSSSNLENTRALNFPEVKANVSTEEQIIRNQGAINLLRSLRARKVDPEQSRIDNEESELLRAILDGNRPENHKLFSNES